MCLLCLENGYLRLDGWSPESSPPQGHPQDVYYAPAARVGCGLGFAAGDLIGVTIDTRSDTLSFDHNGDRTGFGIASRLPPSPSVKGSGGICRTACAVVDIEEPEQEIELL